MARIDSTPAVCTVSFMVVPSVRAWRFSQKALFDRYEVNVVAVHKKGAPAAPLFMLNVTKAVKMSDDMVQFWKSKLAEAKVQE